MIDSCCQWATIIGIQQVKASRVTQDYVPGQLMRGLIIMQRYPTALKHSTPPNYSPRSSAAMSKMWLEGEGKKTIDVCNVQQLHEGKKAKIQVRNRRMRKKMDAIKVSLMVAINRRNDWQQ